MSVSVCLYVCPRSYCQNYTSDDPIFTKVFVHVIYGRGPALLWRPSDTLCISGFMDDIIFAHKLRLLDVAARLRQ